MKLLEIGCARSCWLPYFINEFGFQVSGIDYSEIGCLQAQKILSKTEFQGEIVCADFFNPPEEMLGSFDVVVSFGVVEHFEDTSKCLTDLSKFLKSNGILITIIPNMTGINGKLQNWLNQPVFDIHVPLDLDSLSKANELSGLEIIDACWFLTVNFGVVNLNGLKKNLATYLKSLFLQGLKIITGLIWLIEAKIFNFPNTKILSPYIFVVARKP